ncbi:phosphate ABC transporter permease subunit PstC [Clostridium luticellarii]|jgi:phosphate transport system permease protein|uniref:Phosphate transport system permease protein n=1 Tax=Clostridium luticellarii TaxID=1691940 RepID=A0A2T0BRF4_9CLOT|nr:phosphate ABC transporter permease subunit PstC [Clostridium luticellarii]MCI1943839.1 phosphate ABC transporter permease subunit PstC [Clostridium luticellarii]MCI1967100.1 phosphate ABC transporter permease subunit PstC [Clostridium luticellarii]MCI1994467.1 phosphate ABC transporter permease subunit PstC [Clostridium luticellarii]MCI2038580.1 phosphate ABC transporter permease subunit PstC [Clostridium luticellarii]PRR86454.1 Phosphate transport system permease protein PstC [Clostridium 
MRKKLLWNKFKNEYIGRGFATFCGIMIIVLTLSIIIFIASKGLSTFVKRGYPLAQFLFTSRWVPDASSPRLGAAIFFVGSTLVSIGAVIISAPISIALAVFMNYISPKIGSKILQPSLELFVGIPSVVYGWIGFSVLIPFLKAHFGGIGFSLIAGILVLSVMILPTIASISADALKTIPRGYMEASYGLGATRWQTIAKVIVPSAKNGILTGVVLGLARAFGEALAVQMVIGNTIRFPGGLLSPTATLTSILTMDMGNTVSGTAWNDALWSLALFLLIISFAFILIIRAIGKGSEIK